MIASISDDIIRSMTSPSLTPATLITTFDALQTLCQELLTEPMLAVDTESNSLHAYQGRVCLIQLSTPTQDYIADPILIKDMTPLGAVMSSPNTEKIFHAAEYDILCMKREYGFTFSHLFDTLYAARMVDGQMLGLGELLNTHFGVKADKSHQLDNWGKRPLPESSLHYAQMDTHYLIDLRNHYQARIAAMNALDEIGAVFEDVSHVDPREQAYDPNGFWKLVKPNELNKRQLAILSELFQVRNTIAETMDQPPFKVMDNRVLVNMALQAPGNRRELGSLRGLRGEMIRIYAEDLLGAIQRGTQAEPPRPPSTQRVDQAISDRYIVLHAWRKDKAIARHLESNMVISKQTLWVIAEQVPTTLAELAAIDGVGSWRLAQYGEEILGVLHKHQHP